MLDIQNVSKRYGKTLANDGVSFSVAGGELAVLLGPNGAGKSTLIKCVAGLLRFEGNIQICGHGNKTLEAKRALGYIPEMPAVYDLLTVSEHLEFMRRAWRMEDDGCGEALLRRFELSKGMQQKLSICCQLVHHPRVIIFDEPMVGLDPHAIKELKEIFRELREDGAALLISTHMIDSVEDYWDAAYIMMHGRLAATKRQGDGGERSLEEMFFSITEGGEASK